MELMIFILITLFTALFWFWGHGIQSLLLKSKSGALSYFLGSTVFLSYIKMFSWLGGGFKELTLIFLFLSFVGIIFYLYKNKNKSLVNGFNLKTFGVSILVLLTLASVSSAVWMYDFNYSVESSPHASFGTIESGRYNNIARYILAENTIPRLGQNYAQSIFAALPGVMGWQNGVFALWVWLMVNLTFLVFLIRGILKSMETSPIWIGLTLALIFLGGWSFSIDHTLLFDSVSPLALTGYSDTIMSLGSLLVFFLFLQHHISCEKWSWQSPLVLSVLFYSWFTYAPQNILAAGGLFLFLVTQKKRIWRDVPLLSFFTLFFILGVLQGGMLTPSSLRDQTSIQGLVETQAGSMPIKWSREGLDVLVLDKLHTSFKFTHIPTLEPQQNTGYYEWNTYFENLVKAVGYLFVPIFVFFGYLILRRDSESEDLPLKTFFADSALFLFLLGFLFVFHLSFGPMKWQVSRFMIPGLIMTLMVLGPLGTELDKIRKKFKKPILGILILLLLFISFNQTLPGMMFRLKKGPSWSEKIRVIQSLEGH